MKKMKQLILTEKIQYRVLAIVVIAVIGMAVFLNHFNASFFQRFLGEVNPLFVFLLSGFLAFILLSFLLFKNWFSIYKKESLKNLLPYFGFVGLFLLVSIFVDWKIIYPVDTHIPFPESLLFYPAIAFLVEIIFHVLPLSALLFLLTTFFKNKNLKFIIWNCIVIVAILEPTYQVAFMDSFPMWSKVVIWINLFLFNLTQLYIFKKYDFTSMLLFRLFYYSIWHIAWGHLRLGILF